MEEVRQKILELAQSAPKKEELADVLNIIQKPKYLKFYHEIKELVITLPEAYQNMLVSMCNSLLLTLASKKMGKSLNSLLEIFPESVLQQCVSGIVFNGAISPKGRQIILGLYLKFTTSDCAELVTSLLKKDGSYAVQKQCLKWLKDNEIELDEKADLEEILIKLARDSSNIKTQVLALEALSNFAAPDIIFQLLVDMSQDVSEEVRLCAWKLMEFNSLPTKSLIAIIKKGVHDKNSEVKTLAQSLLLKSLNKDNYLQFLHELKIMENFAFWEEFLAQNILVIFEFIKQK